MKKKEDKWVDCFRNRLKDHQEPVPEQLWAELERELNAPKVIPLYRRAGMVAAVAAVAVLTSVSVWWIGREGGKQAQNTQLAQEFQKVVPPDGQVSPKPENEGLTATPQGGSSAPHLAMAASATNNNRYRTRATATAEEVSPLAAMVSAMTASGDSVQTAQASQVSEEGAYNEKTQKTEPHPKTEARRYRSAFSNRMVAQVHTPHNRNSRWEVGVSMGNVPGGIENHGSGYQDFSLNGRNSVIALMGTPDYIPSDGASNYASQVYSELLTKNLNRDVTSRSTHKMPFTVGVSFRWHLNDRWAVESGLTYSKLASDLWSGTERNYYTTAQKLHYVGIPIKGSYRIWSNRYVAFYASAGGEVEKCVSGSQERVGVVDGVAKTSEKKDLDVNQLQWSALAAMGAEVKATKHLGIYLEPGMHYYFDDGSDISTIRKEHPLNFTIQAGLRLSY